MHNDSDFKSMHSVLSSLYQQLLMCSLNLFNGASLKMVCGLFFFLIFLWMQIGKFTLECKMFWFSLVSRLCTFPVKTATAVQLNF